MSSHMMRAFQDLSPSGLRDLARFLDSCGPGGDISPHPIQQIVGLLSSEDVICSINDLLATNWTLPQIATMTRAVADAKECASIPEHLFDLVLSGPDVPGVPTRDTMAVMRSMIEEAEKEVLLVGYAVHNARRLFEPLASKMSAKPHLRVRFCLNIARPQNDETPESDLVAAFLKDFREKHWPWAPIPEVYYDPRALTAFAGTRTSLHAKCLIVDNTIALITSANFTEAAYFRNVEAGVVIRYAPLVGRLREYFDALCSAVFRRL